MPPLALPPHVPHASVPLSPSSALILISTYLKESESSPHLHPDTLLTPSGPTYSAASGSSGGLVLHNLRRVEAGLKGERLMPEPEPEGDDTVLDGLIAQAEEGRALKRDRGKKRKAGELVDGETLDSGEAAAGAEEATTVGDAEGWQDPDEYRRENEEDGIEEGELGARNNFVVSGGEEPSVRATAPQEDGVEAAGGREKGKVDKEARKKAKKERVKGEKKERAAKRREDKT